MRRFSRVATAAVWIAAPASSSAQSTGFDQFPAVTDRGFALDLYQGAVLGSTRLLGMGGAGVALAEGAEGMVWNPAAPAVRAASSHDHVDWDWNLDWLNPQIGSDFDNNGVPTTQVGETVIVLGGLVLDVGRWGFGVNLSSQRYTIERAPEDGGAVETFEPGHLVSHAFVARSFLDGQLAIGGGLRGGSFDLRRDPPGPGAKPKLIELAGANLQVGAAWRPRDRPLRAGASLALPVSSTSLVPGECNDPTDCAGFVVPSRAVVPWQVAAGVAWRPRGNAAWNAPIAGRWRDERNLVLAADVVVSGGVDDGYGVEAYVNNRLQRSGSATAISLRAGAEYEWLPGRFRVRGGSYWEPPRFAETGGRLHLTLGLELRVWQFCFWDERYRLRVALTADAAERYGNGALSLGLWH